jgi:hypothetical protein
MRASFVALLVILLTTWAFAQSRDSEAVIVGPWAIATTYKAEEFESCTMGRSAGELGITFVREREGLLVVLNSPKWKLNRGKAYSVRLVAGSRSVDAQALAETKSVTIAFEDPRLKSELRLANVLEVRGEGATLRVPLDGSSTAFQRLEACVNKRASETNPFVKREVSETNQSETNPFVKREAAETNPFVASSRKPRG